MNIDNIKKKLMLYGKEKKSRSRVAMKFSFNNKEACNFPHANLSKNNKNTNAEDFLSLEKYVDENKKQSNVCVAEKFDVHDSPPSDLHPREIDGSVLGSCYETKEFLNTNSSFKTSQTITRKNTVSEMSFPDQKLLIGMNNISQESLSQSNSFKSTAISAHSYQPQTSNQIDSTNVPKKLELNSKFLGFTDDNDDDDDYKSVAESHAHSYDDDQNRVINLDDLILNMTQKSQCNGYHNDRSNVTNGDDNDRSNVTNGDDNDSNGDEIDSSQSVKSLKSLHSEGDDDDDQDETLLGMMDALSNNLNSEDVSISIFEDNDDDDDDDYDDGDQKNDDDNCSDPSFNQKSLCLEEGSVHGINLEDPSVENLCLRFSKARHSFIISDVSGIHKISHNPEAFIDYRVIEKMVESHNLIHQHVFYRPDRMMLEVSEMLTQKRTIHKNMKLSVDQAIQTEISMDEQSIDSIQEETFSDVCSGFNQSNKSSSTFPPGRIIAEVMNDKKENLIKTSSKASLKSEHLGRSSQETDKNKLNCKSGSEDIAMIRSLDTYLPSMTTSGLNLEHESTNHKRLNMWKEEKLAELNKKKEEIIEMCQKDIELLYLKKEEIELKNRLKKVTRRRKVLEEWKASIENSFVRSFEVSGSTSLVETSLVETSLGETSLVETSLDVSGNAQSSCTSDFVFPEKTCLTGCCKSPCQNHSSQDVHSLRTSKNIDSVDLKSTDAKEATLSIDDQCTQEFVILDSKRKAAFNTLCLRLGPIIKGYIVRRLFKCFRVEDIIKTLMDTAKEVLVLLPTVYSENCSRADRSYFETLERQLESRFNELKEIFTGLSSKEQMEIIAKQRSLEQNKVFQAQKPTSMQINSTTRKSYERRQKKLEELCLLKSHNSRRDQSNVTPVIQSSNGCSKVKPIIQSISSSRYPKVKPIIQSSNRCSKVTPVIQSTSSDRFPKVTPVIQSISSDRFPKATPVIQSISSDRCSKVQKNQVRITTNKTNSCNNLEDHISIENDPSRSTFIRPKPPILSGKKVRKTNVNGHVNPHGVKPLVKKPQPNGWR